MSDAPGRYPTLTLRARRVLTPDVELETTDIAIVEGRIASVAAARPAGRVVDLGDRIVVPGFVDLHVHGGGGAQVNAGSPAEVAAAVRTIAAAHVRHGTTALVPTTVSDSRERLVTAVRGIAAARDDADGPTVLGAHLEGPWLSPQHAGAQDPSALRPPSLGEFADLQAAAPGTVRMITLAPELRGALDVVRAAAAAGIVVSVGHTDADVDTARAAADAGATHATHLFNAMPPLHHRAPGAAGAVLTDSRVTVEVVADGHHVHPAVLALVAAAAPGRFVAVTDAMAATGLPAGDYHLGNRAVRVAGGRVTLLDAPDTLAGSVLTMDAAVRTLVGAGVPLAAAVTAATRTPADAIGACAKGRIAAGTDADLVVLEPDLTIAAVLTRGRVAHDPAGLFRGETGQTG